MEYSVELLGKKKMVEVTEKSVRRVRLKVFPSQEIKLTVPNDTPTDWVTSFLVSKTKWMEEKLTAFEKTQAVEKEDHIRTGVSTRVLGRQYIVRVIQANRKYVEITDNELLLYTPNKEMQMDVDKQYNNWWQKTSKQYFLNRLDDLYPIIQKHEIQRPDVKVAKMKTLWGSCSRRMNKINLNYYLLKAPPPCIEYVILHELTHFLYPRHDKNFLDFLSVHMPDWRERAKLLDNEIVLGM